MNNGTSAERLAGVELRYCFLCDADAPHLSMEIEGQYVFQCGACFATHAEPVGPQLLQAGRHRVA